MSKFEAIFGDKKTEKDNSPSPESNLSKAPTSESMDYMEKLGILREKLRADIRQEKDKEKKLRLKEKLISVLETSLGVLRQDEGWKEKAEEEMIYTDEMIIEEAKKHPDFKENEKIWKQIRNGKFDNIKKLTFITNELMEILIENNIPLYLYGLQSAQGLKLPETMNGNLYLYGLQSAEGLKLPETMNGNLYLHGLQSAQGLELPETINGYLNLYGLQSAQGLKLPETMNGNLNLSGLQSAEGLKLPETMNGYLGLNGLQSAEGLKLPETINGYLWLDGLKPPITETAIKYLAEYEGCKERIHFNTAVQELIDKFRKKNK